jgi:phosphoribosylformylglycinamidine synthase
MLLIAPRALLGGLQVGDESPDVEASALTAAFETTQSLLRQRMISAGHDISDGGAAVGLLEMAFGGNTGIEVRLL